MPIQLKGTVGKTSVELSVTIRKILHVDEVGKSLTVKFESRRRWFDRQLTFQNLKLAEDLNVDPALSEKSGSTWFPWIDFYNVESNNKVSLLLTIIGNFFWDPAIIIMIHKWWSVHHKPPHRRHIHLAVTIGL